MWDELVFFLMQGARGMVFLLIAALAVGLIAGTSASVLFLIVSGSVLAAYLSVALAALGFLSLVQLLLRDPE